MAARTPSRESGCDVTAAKLRVTGSIRFAVLRADRVPAPWEEASISRLLDIGCELVAIVTVADHRAKSSVLERFAERLAQGPRGSMALWPNETSATRVRLAQGAPVEAIRLLQLDFVLAFEAPDTFLWLLAHPDTVARDGIWTHAFAVGGQHATLPEGFDAVDQGKALAAVSLVRLGSSGAVVRLEEEWLRVETHSYRRTRLALTSAAADLAVRYLRRVQTAQVGDPAPDAGRPPLGLAATHHRRALAVVRLLARLFVRTLAEILRRALFRQDWNVGVVQRPISEVLTGLDARDIEWLPQREGDTFLADPFGMPLADGNCLVLAEEFVGASARGRIVAATIDGSRYVHAPQPVLELDTHLSYPFIVAADDGWFFTPESSAAAEVASYRLDSTSGPAVRSDTLLEDFAAVDPTLVEYDGRWWLFATDGRVNADGHLHVWHGDGPRGPWTAHELNPVKCDVRSARPGGTPFTIDGVLYRPAQDDGGAYGGALVINRIDRLTPVAFEETVVARLDPDPHGPYPSGIHTISSAGALLLVDGKRYRFSPMTKLRRRLSRWSVQVSPLRVRLWPRRPR